MERKNKVTIDRFTQYKKQKTLALIFTTVVFVGAAAVGVLLVLSEVLYGQIEEFALLPLGYRITMYVSLILVFGGLIGCGFTKNRQNTTQTELTINIAMFFIGFTLSLFFALCRAEGYWNNVFICIGGAISSVAFFLGIASLIGLSKKSKSVYAALLKSYARERQTSSLKLIPASLIEVIEVEEYFNAMLPTDLVEFLLEFNGDGELLFSTGQIVEITQHFRENLKNSPFKADHLCFIGHDGKGNYFCYSILEDGIISSDFICLWNPKSEKLTPVADTLPELISKYYSGLLNIAGCDDSDEKQTASYESKEYDFFVEWWSNVNEKDIENDEKLFGAYQIMWYYNEIANGGFDQFWDFAENSKWDLQRMQKRFDKLLPQEQVFLFSEALEAHMRGQDCEQYNALFDYSAFDEQILPQIAKMVAETLEKQNDAF